MKIAKAKITNKKIFNKIKAALNQNSYVECGLCGAIHVEAIEVASVLHSFIDYGKNADDKLNDFCADFIGQIIESAPAEFESIEAYEKWEAANEKGAYHFLDDDGYESEMYGSYDELIIFYDSNCDCFGKEKIKNGVVVDW